MKSRRTNGHSWQWLLNEFQQIHLSDVEIFFEKLSPQNINREYLKTAATTDAKNIAALIEKVRWTEGSA
jgi:hypothetical protein